MRSSKFVLVLAAPMLALAVSACGGNGGTTNNQSAAAAKPGTGDLKDALGSADGLDTVHDIAKTAGLDTVLSGIGPYTIFAPTDQAFDALGKDQVSQMKGDAMKAQDASLLKAHIVPGFLTTDDIRNAIKNDHGKVEMTTMANGKLTFSDSNGQIMVTADNGAKAMLTGNQTLASNGAVHPVSALLVPASGAGATTNGK